MTYPTIRPELTLDFANSRQLDPRITFSRTSGATYLNPDTGLITLASEHEARFEKEGLLIEESRTNEIYNSNAKVYQTGQPFTTAGNIWQSCSDPSQGIITNISTTSEAGPDGLSGVTKIAPEAGISYDLNDFTARDGFQIGFANTGNLKAITGFFKPSGCDILNVRWGNYSTSRAVYTFNTSTLVVTGSDASIVALANGWFKFQITNLARQSLTFGCSKSNGDPNNGVDGVLIWGVQSEDNVSFPSSYIPTAGSTVTRASDFASITGTNFSSWYSQGESSFVVSADRADGLPASQFTVMTTNGFRLPEFKFTNTGAAQVFNNITGTYTSPTALLKATFGFSFDGTGVIRYINGLGTSFGSASLVDTNTALYLGNYLNNATLYILTGHISRLSYYPRKLTELELQTLTL